MRVLLLDNFDSFTYNLVHAVEPLVDEVVVVRNNQFSLSDLPRYDRVILSPGPGLPADAGVMPQLLREATEERPILGVCLGLQAMVECEGGTLFNLPQVKHGVSSPVQVLHATDPLLDGISSPFEAGRYHSWGIRQADLPETLQTLAVDEDGVVMALKHRSKAWYGVQFHPESILTPVGNQLLANWVKKS